MYCYYNESSLVLVVQRHNHPGPELLLSCSINLRSCHFMTHTGSSMSSRYVYVLTPRSKKENSMSLSFNYSFQKSPNECSLNLFILHTHLILLNWKSLGNLVLFWAATCPPKIGRFYDYRRNGNQTSVENHVVNWWEENVYILLCGKIILCFVSEIEIPQ